MPSPSGEGILCLLFCAMRLLNLLANVSFEEDSSLSPLGETGEGFCFARVVRTKVLPQGVEVGAADSVRSTSMY